MAAQPQFLQHNWTGLLAVFAPVPKQPLLAHAVKGVSNSKARGTWIKAASHARLRLKSCLTDTSMIEVHLGAQPLLVCPLSGQQLSMKLLSDSCISSGNILIITPKQQEKTAAPVHYCFQFFDEADCTSFKLALETMRVSRINKLQQERQEQLQVASQSIHVPCAAGPGPADLLREPMEVLHTVRPAAGGSILASPGAFKDHQKPVVSTSGAGVKKLIKQYLMDPSFQAYVDKVDALWNEVEQELELTTDIDTAAAGEAGKGLGEISRPVVSGSRAADTGRHSRS